LTSNPEKTPLYGWHVTHGARLIDFGGWSMPLQYKSILEEHEKTRRYAGLFDVCHMGEIDIRGAEAQVFLQHVLTRNVASLSPGRMKLSLILNDEGGIKDDVTVYVFGEDKYRLVTNATTREKIVHWLFHLRERLRFHKVTIDDVSTQTDQRSILQGPAGEEILAPLCEDSVSLLGYYRFVETTVAQIPTLISRSGYTGEDGFEMYIAPHHAPTLWETLLTSGREHGLIPVGLGARDTLRLEAGLMLYGNDLDETVNPYEVVYGWAVDLERILLGERHYSRSGRTDLPANWWASSWEERGIARHGQTVHYEEREVGQVTSGTYAPTLGKAIGMAFLPPSSRKRARPITIHIRGQHVAARVISLPFYRRTDRKKGVHNGKGTPSGS